MGRDKKFKPFAIGDKGYSEAREQASRWFKKPKGTEEPSGGAGGSAGTTSMSDEELAAAGAARDKHHTTKLSVKVKDQMESQVQLKARKEAALQWFNRQFLIRGGRGWGVGSKAGRPTDRDKVLSPRAIRLSEVYASDTGEYSNMTPHEWWAQSEEAKALYQNEGWSHAIEPDGEDLSKEGSSKSQDCWVEELGDGQTVVKYFKNPLVKEVLRSCWYMWAPSGKFIGIRSVEEWRLACMSKFDATSKGSLPGRSQAYEWRKEELDRVKRRDTNTEVPGSTLAFRSRPDITAMLLQIDRDREEAKSLMRVSEPTTGRPPGLSRLT